MPGGSSPPSLSYAAPSGQGLYGASSPVQAGAGAMAMTPGVNTNTFPYQPGSAHAVSPDSMSLEEALYHLSSCSDFMAFLFRHISCCTPRGPFRYYAALTFVVRARQRYGPSGLGSDHGAMTLSTSSGKASDGASNENAAPPGPPRFANENAAALYAAISVRSVLALMEQKFSTDHLENWPLFYVPCEVHVRDVERMMQEQQQQ